ncbi:hypothetical protein PROFUN_15456, partial [Planoprotostelium fungivorum]
MEGDGEFDWRSNNNAATMAAGWNGTNGDLKTDQNTESPLAREQDRYEEEYKRQLCAFNDGRPFSTEAPQNALESCEPVHPSLLFYNADAAELDPSTMDTEYGYDEESNLHYKFERGMGFRWYHWNPQIQQYMEVSEMYWQPPELVLSQPRYQRIRRTVSTQSVDSDSGNESGSPRRTHREYKKEYTASGEIKYDPSTLAPAGQTASLADDAKSNSRLSQTPNLLSNTSNASQTISNVRNSNDALQQTNHNNLNLTENNEVKIPSYCGLYYDGYSDLYYNEERFQDTSFHWDPKVQVFRVVKLLEVPEHPMTGTNNVDEGHAANHPESPANYKLIMTEIDDDENGTETIVVIGEKPDDDKYSRCYTIGRDKKNDIVVSDTNVSKNHAKILWEKIFFVNYWWLMDDGSVNGTFLNGVRLSLAREPSEPKKNPLSVGDVIEIGSRRIRIAEVDQESLDAEGDDRTPEQVHPSTTNPLSITDNKKLRRQFLRTKEEKTVQKGAVVRYRDRAADRRNLHGIETPAPAPPSGSSFPYKLQRQNG